MANLTRPTNVYVARGKYGHKIGMAGKVPARLRFVKREHGSGAELVRSWHRPNDARDVEHAAHQVLDRWRHWHGGREWFRVSEIVAVNAVEHAITLVEAGNFPKSVARLQREKRLMRGRRCTRASASSG